ncbi:hypothetical protein HBI56_199470 [Parastagonospora nodorum]|nr:hypothetical protein HBI10_209500 [Parastagonospora nodorum]KAH4010740.1 hypothetical protein HBI13_206700 [Parastagonospora nodorum]KAH4187719.1 hypothetical protein HBI95_233790 [Parastagonospora nodorum]KAH4217468.1 hypothetical protein HBI06_214580 [Parastagonospora nodorum]KAH4229478.1 hypothetical protein HBI05_196400 [Parastagonospora nodorum]
MTKGDDYTDFIERWYYLRPKPTEGQAEVVAAANEKDMVKASQGEIDKAEKEPEAREEQEVKEVMKENESSRLDQLGPSC